MSADEDETVWVSESPSAEGRVSQRAIKYHTDEDCRQLDRPLEVPQELAERRNLGLCAHCDGGIDRASCRKGYAWTIKGMDDEEREALAASIGGESS